MATKQSLPEYQVYEICAASGLLSGFTDINGNVQPAPRIEYDMYDQANQAKLPNERFVSFLKVGGNSAAITSYNSEYPFTIVVSGIENSESDRLVAYGLAEDLNKYIEQVSNPTINCIFDIVSQGVRGPYKTDSSRYAYEINLTAKFNIL